MTASVNSGALNNVDIKPRDLFALLAVVSLWGLNFVVFKIGVQVLPPLFLVGVRFVLSAVVLLPFVVFPKNRLLDIFYLSVVMGVVHFGLIVIGLTRVDAAIVAVVIQLGVPFSVLFGWLFFGDTFGWYRSFGLVVAFTGVAVLAGSPKGESDLLYLLMVMGGAMAWSIGNIISKRLSGVPPLSIIAYMSLMAAPMLFVLSPVIEANGWPLLWDGDWKMFAIILYMGLLSTVVAYGLWYHLLGKYPVNKVVPFTLLAPLIGMAGGVFILGEELGDYALLGGVLTLSGVAFIQYRSTKISNPTIEEV